MPRPNQSAFPVEQSVKPDEKGIDARTWMAGMVAAGLSKYSFSYENRSTERTASFEKQADQIVSIADAILRRLNEPLRCTTKTGEPPARVEDCVVDVSEMASSS